MLISAEVSVSDLVNAVIAIGGLLLGIRAELRSRSDQKRESNERKALAYSKLAQILEVGERLRIKSPHDIRQHGINDSLSKLKQLASLAHQAIPALSAIFPQNVLLLEWLARDAKRLAEAKGDARQDDKLYADCVKGFSTIYTMLFSLSVLAFNQRELRPELFNPEEVVWNDPLYQEFDGRATAFRNENEILIQEFAQEALKGAQDLIAEMRVVADEIRASTESASTEHPKQITEP